MATRLKSGSCCQVGATGGPGPCHCPRKPGSSLSAAAGSRLGHGPLLSPPHLQPSHSLRSSLRKTQLAGEPMSLSGIPLKARDLRHITRYLSSQGAGLAVLDPSFSELTEELLHLLVPSLWALPCLSQLLLNG